MASTTESLPNGPAVTLAYQYNPAGQRTQMAAFVDSSCDFVDDYSYDSLGRVVSVDEHGVSGGDAVANKEIDLTYNSDGELATVDRYEDGVLAVEGDYTYDSAGDLIGLVYHQGDTVLASYAWTYSDGTATLSAGSSNADWLPSGGTVPVHDTTGVTSALMSGGYAGLDEVTSCTSVDGTASYSYDATGQLTGATYSASNPESLAPSPESYTYDANGNRVTANGDVYATGADNELLSDGTYTYAYDGEGNRTAKFIDANHDGVLDVGDTDVTEYMWDNRDRLVEVKDYATEGGSPTEVVDYLYDVEDRWIGENIFNGTEHQIRFAYDGNQIVLEFEKDGSGQLAASNMTHRYTWLPNAVDQLMSDEQTATGQVVWTLGDNQGTIKDLAVIDSGVTSVVNHRTFDSFGNLTSAINPLTNQAATVDCLFGYTGRAKDSVTGLQNNGERWYDARVAGWLTQDPIGFRSGTTNLYVYCGNNPTSLLDPTGLEPTTAVATGGLLAGLGAAFAEAGALASFAAGDAAPVLAYEGYMTGERLSKSTTVPLVEWWYAASSEPAAERTARNMADQVERDLGKEARRRFHNLKDGADRTLEQLREDAAELYREAGKRIPDWMRPRGS